MDVKVVYANPNGTLSILPDADAAEATWSWRPSSVTFAAAYLTLSSAAIASNLMVLTGIVTTDRLRSPYAVLVSALCLQCAMDAAVGHYVTTKELMVGGGGGGVGTTPCRIVATVTAALSTVQLITFAALTCLNAFVRADYADLPMPAAAALWAAPSMYTYVILTPTLLFSTRYFPFRGRCGFIANAAGWFYPSLLMVFSFMIPWSISFYFVFVSRPPTTTTPAPKSSNILPASSTRTTTGQICHRVPTKLIFASYTVLVTPNFVSSCVYLYGGGGGDNPYGDPWTERDSAGDIADGYLSKLPIVFDVLVPLVLVHHHKAFRKKCRELYLHGFRNSVSDDSRGAAGTDRRRPGPDRERLTDDAPVLFLERSGVINVRYPSDDGFVMKACDLDDDPNGKKAVRFSRRACRAPNESGVGFGAKQEREAEEEEEEEESSL